MADVELSIDAFAVRGIGGCPGPDSVVFEFRLEAADGTCTGSARSAPTPLTNTIRARYSAGLRERLDLTGRVEEGDSARILVRVRRATDDAVVATGHVRLSKQWTANSAYEEADEGFPPCEFFVSYYVRPYQGSTSTPQAARPRSALARPLTASRPPSATGTRRRAEEQWLRVVVESVENLSLESSAPVELVVGVSYSMRERRTTAVATTLQLGLHAASFAAFPVEFQRSADNLTPTVLVTLYAQPNPDVPIGRARLTLEHRDGYAAVTGHPRGVLRYRIEDGHAERHVAIPSNSTAAAGTPPVDETSVAHLRGTFSPMSAVVEQPRATRVNEPILDSIIVGGVDVSAAIAHAVGAAVGAATTKLEASLRKLELRVNSLERVVVPADAIVQTFDAADVERRGVATRSDVRAICRSHDPFLADATDTAIDGFLAQCGVAAASIAADRISRAEFEVVSSRLRQQ
jgi:hypothetical protein